jgi:hypothetical protein
LLDRAATGEALRRLATDDLARLSPDDSLVLFFAGHGHTHTAHFGDVSVKTGCVIPVDAAPPDGHVSASWLRLDAWLSDIARLPPRHILVIVDACYSGVSLSALHRWREDGGSLPRPLAALHARRSRCIITSALDDQRALDSGPYPGHSLFTGCLLEGLSGGLAQGGRRVVTGRELGLYLQQRVRSYPESTQTPDFGRFELDDRGDILVPVLSEPTPRREPAEPRRIDLDMAGPVARQPGSPWRRSRATRWSTMGIVSGVLVFWLALIPGGASPSVPTAPLAPVDAGPTAIAADSVAPEIPDAAQKRPEPSPEMPGARDSRRTPAPCAPPSDAPEPICNLAVVKAVCHDASPTRADKSNALQQLRVCREAGAITDADFERFHEALIAK